MQVLAALSAMEGMAAFFWLMSLPTNRQTFSAFRLAGLMGILIVILFFAAVLIYLRRQKRGSAEYIEKIAKLRNWKTLSFFLLTFSSILWIAILHKDTWLLHVSESTYARLVPLLAYSMMLCLQAGIFLFVIHHDRSSSPDVSRPILKPSLLLAGIFLAAWIFISISKLGFIHDEVGLSWGPPGTPITFAQSQLVLAAGFLSMFGWHILKSRFFLPPMRDVLVFLGLWILAVILWWNQPASPTHFSPPPMAPNQEVYPNSDALIFDRSSYHLLYGIGFDNQLTRRPLYVGMLALFHKMAGATYESTIFLQILLLALIPPLVYLLTSKLSNRLSGLVAGGLILLREMNSLELSGVLVTSHAKMMMSDMMATLGIVLFVYVSAKWLASERAGNWEPAIMGACLGLTALIRAQVLILLPVLLLFILPVRKPLTQAFRASLFAVLGLAMVMSPWVWRNWNLTGTFVLDDRGEERLLARNYSLTPFSLPSPLPGETEREFSARLKEDILEFICTHPEQVLFFVSNHFLRNMAVSSVYLAPTYSTNSPATLVERLPYWNDWTGDLTRASGIALFINLIVVAFGVGIAMGKNKYTGLFPFAAFLMYAFGNALVRSSGWRFIQPVDWVILVYYSIALAYLPSKVNSIFREAAPVRPVSERMVTGCASYSPAFILTILFMLGAAVTIAERLIPAREYESFTEKARAELSKEGYLSAAEISTFLEQEDAVLSSGVALYPRYVRPNARVYLAEAPRGYRYLHFWLINEGDHQIILPLQNPPDNIPHTATVSVIGCRIDSYIAAFAVIVHEPSSQILLLDPQSPFLCPETEPGD